MTSIMEHTAKGWELSAPGEILMEKAAPMPG
jgi:hypothetical protein